MMVNCNDYANYVKAVTDQYLGSACVTLETQAGDGCFMCHSDPGGGAGIPQVILVNLSLGSSDHQAGAV